MLSSCPLALRITTLAASPEESWIMTSPKGLAGCQLQEELLPLTSYGLLALSLPKGAFVKISMQLGACRKPSKHQESQQFQP